MANTNASIIILFSREGDTWANFCWVCAAGLSVTLPNYSVCVDFILVTFGQICKFRDPNLVTFYLCMYLILNKELTTFHLQYKHSCTFANRKYEELSYPKNHHHHFLLTLISYN